MITVRSIYYGRHGRNRVTRAMRARREQLIPLQPMIGNDFAPEVIKMKLTWQDHRYLKATKVVILLALLVVLFVLVRPFVAAWLS